MKADCAGACGVRGARRVQDCRARARPAGRAVPPSPGRTPPALSLASRSASEADAPRRRIPLASKIHGQLQFLLRYVRDCASSAGGFRTAGRIHSRRVTIASAPLLDERVHDGHHAIPLGLLVREAAPAGGGQAVKARLPIVVRDAPLAVDEAALFEAREPRIQRSHVHVECAGGRSGPSERRWRTRAAARAWRASGAPSD